MVKRVLMIAYHFPPMNLSSGLQRTLRFAQYLPQFGWEPTVLTVHPRAYPSVSPAGMAEVPPDLSVHRAFALDMAKHGAFRGIYPRSLAIPDRWASWWLGAVPRGLSIVRQLKPDLIWSTYPVATAHLIAHSLHRRTAIKWVADFRDPMAQTGYPTNRVVHRAFRWIEHRALKHCAKAVFTAQGALQLYADRYPEIPPTRMAIVENGYDEASFAEVEQNHSVKVSNGAPLLLVHSGTLYPSERDPRPFFSALSELIKAGELSGNDLKIVLRATGSDDYIKSLIDETGIGSIVTIEPSVPYQAALAEMLDADGLLVLQASHCNYQIPAKLYEYLRAQRPILALTDPLGDTAAVLRGAGIDTIAPLDSSEAIKSQLMKFLSLVRTGKAPIAIRGKISEASRFARTGELAKLFDEVSLTA